MKNVYRVKDNPSDQMSQIRDYLINNISIYNYSHTIRNLLDSALSYAIEPSEEPVECRERELKHILINHIRHKNSNYDEHLKQIYMTDKFSRDRQKIHNTNYMLYKNAVLDAIADAYPFLKKECKQQKRIIKIKKQSSQ